jgi:2-dehydro-3-deoxyphosphogluconate aldolase/(4S)-4-hydroxy-2-oxoglutarate aldolase
VGTAHAEGIAAIPGALSPQEILDAREEGADAIKLFPARAVQPAHITDLLAVMPDLRLFATGGIAPSPQEVARWLHAGAIALGCGAPQLPTAEQLEGLRRTFGALLGSTREGP